MVKRVLVGYGIDADAVSGWYVFWTYASIMTRTLTMLVGSILEPALPLVRQMYLEESLVPQWA